MSRVLHGVTIYFLVIMLCSAASRARCLCKCSCIASYTLGTGGGSSSWCVMPHVSRFTRDVISITPSRSSASGSWSNHIAVAAPHLTVHLHQASRLHSLRNGDHGELAIPHCTFWRLGQHGRNYLVRVVSKSAAHRGVLIVTTTGP